MTDSISSTGVHVTETTTTEESRPGWLPEKFKSAEDLAKAYSELEQKLGSSNQESPPAELNGQTISENMPKELPEDLDIQPFSKEYAQTGQLSEDSYKSLAEKGLSREFVDSYIEGQKALADARANQGFALVGGKADYAKMIQWAAKNLSKSEIAAFDASVASSTEQMAFAVQGLHARYIKAVGGDPQLLSGGSAVTNQSGAFTSLDELHNAMRDPKYGKDRVYTQMVEQKLLASNF